MNGKKNISDVLDKYLCTSCGTCAGVCPVNAIEMVEWPGGVLRPEIKDTVCNNCGLCFRVCPGMQVQRTKVNHGNPFVGEISASYAGQITDVNLLATAQSGGIVTGLLLHALESGYIDAALVTSQDMNGSVRPAIKLTDEPDEIISAQQSKYCPVALNTFLSMIRNLKKRIAVVGLPCHMHGLWNVEKESPDFLNNVVMRIGLFCDRTLTYGAIDSLIRSAGVQDQKITEFRYRSKKWKGWPGDVYIKNSDGEEINLPREIRYIIKDDFTPVRCRLCYDKLNTFADISVGDSYGLGESAEGISSIIIRNENIHKLILSAVKSGKIRLRDVDPYRIVCGQAIGERIKQFTLFSSAWEKIGYVAPEYRLNYNYTKVDESIDLSSYENVLRSELRFHESRIPKNEYQETNNELLINTGDSAHCDRKAPLVTVLMTIGSNDRFIKNSIESVLGQTYQNLELIIAGDKSNKQLKRLLKNINSNKIKLVEKKSAETHNFHSFIYDNAAGDYITLLESPDEYEKNKIEIEVALMLGFPKLDAVYSNLNIIDGNGKSLGLVWSYNNRMPEDLRLRLLRNGGVNVPLHAIMMRKETACELQIHNMSSLTTDNQLVSELSAGRKIKHIHLPLYRYRCTSTDGKNIAA